MTGVVVERPQKSFAFGGFVLIPERQLLLQGGVPVRLGGRAIDILTVLVERPGELLSKAEIFARVWPDTVVEDSNLKVHMVALRRALGEEAGSARYIATVIGGGYRFVAPVQSLEWAGVTPARKHNLPAATTRIVGRAETIEELRRELADARLVSIVGPGGVGKTTVALAVAEQACFADGVWLVDLGPLKDPALVPSAIATAIGLTAQSANVLAAISDYVRQRELLLVLDNCEHLVAAVAACAERILADAGQVKLLATTREPLGVRGERVRRLQGLATPPDSRDLSAAQALTFPAIQLFVDRATDGSRAFQLTDAEAHLAAAIVRKLDGLALALELVATRVETFGLGGLLEQLNDRFRLAVSRRAGPERQRTLTATIEWSYDLLSAGEQSLVRRLAVFAGGFGLGSALAVSGDEPGYATEALANLVAKSLVSAEASHAEVEYRLLDTTRSYALQKLIGSSELDATRQRHAEHVLALAGPAKAASDVLPRAAWVQRYGAKIDDVRDALRWSFGDPERASLSVKLTVAAIPFWEQLSLLEECRVAVERALGESLAGHRGERDELSLHQALGAALLYTRGPTLEVHAAISRALEIAQRLDDTEPLLECLRALSDYHLWAGDARAGLAVTERIRALAASRGLGTADTHSDAQAGSALRYMGDLAASRRRLESIAERPAADTVRRCTARFDFDQRLTARGSLATVLWLQGFPEQAIETARRQREQAEASNYVVSLCSALVITSAVSVYVRDLEAAGKALDYMEQYTTEHGLALWHAMATCLRGRWLLDRGETFDLPAFRKALGVIREGGLRMRMPAYLTNLGDGLAQLGDFEGAHAKFDEAIAFSESSGQAWGIPEILRLKGNALRAQRKEGAAEHYARSIELARKQGALSWELRTAISALELHRDARSEQTLASAYARFSEGFDTGDLRRARSLLEGVHPG